MKIGMTALFNNSSAEPREDSAVYATDVRLALLAEPLGFDSLWTVEHHFSDYCLAPDPFQTLTWFAAKTSRIELGSMVVVLPWWRDPVRIVEKAALLDELSGGRFILGIGRGSARREYEGFGISQEESRGRFDETRRDGNRGPRARLLRVRRRVRQAEESADSSHSRAILQRPALWGRHIARVVCD